MRLKIFLSIPIIVLAGCSLFSQADPVISERCELIWETGGWDSFEHCIEMQSRALEMANSQRRILGLE